MNVINTVIPVFLIIAFGAWLRKSQFISAELVNGLNRLVYWIALPTLLFYEIATASYDYRIAGETFLVVLAGTIGSIVAAYVVAAVIRMPAGSIGSFVQGAFRSNLLYVGLPIIIYSFTNGGDFNADNMKKLAIVLMAPLIPIYNVAAVLALLAGRHKLDRSVPLKMLRQIFANPILLACVAGGVYLLVFPPLPIVVVRACTAVGQIALPLALICIGATLVQGRIAGRYLYAFAGSVIKIILSPVLGLLAARLLGLGPAETKVALILLACPTATVSYVMAEQLGGDEQLSAAIVVVSTLLSLLSLSLVVGLF